MCTTSSDLYLPVVVLEVAYSTCVYSSFIFDGEMLAISSEHGRYRGNYSSLLHFFRGLCCRLSPSVMYHVLFGFFGFHPFSSTLIQSINFFCDINRSVCTQLRSKDTKIDCFAYRYLPCSMTPNFVSSWTRTPRHSSCMPIMSVPSNSWTSVPLSVVRVPS